MTLALNLNKFNFLYSPEDSGNAGSKEITKGGILDALNDDSTDSKKDELELEDDADTKDKKEDKLEDDEEVIEDEDKTKEDDEDEEDELAELEEDLKDPTDEDLELTTPVKKREILAKYPTIFKDFPSLEKSYYRELEYTKLLPTINDAKEAVNAVNVLNSFEKDLNDGNIENVFSAINKENPNAFAKVADNLLDTIKKVDERAFLHILGNTTKDIVAAMVKTSKNTENKELGEAATLLYQFMFGDTDWKPKTKLSIDTSAEENDGKKALDKERQEFEQGKYTDTSTKLMNGVTNRIKSVIDLNIDKKDEMSPFVKKNAVKEVNDQVADLMKRDSRFQTIIKQLWLKARDNKYSQEYLQKIESAHVSKAKSLLPTVIKSVRKEALNSKNKSRVRDDSEETNENKSTKTRNSAPPRNNKADQTDKSKPLPGESTLSFLSR